MASLTNTKTLFAFTSPRTLEKITPEINILSENFSGRKWSGNSALQAEFFQKLQSSEFYEGSQKVKDPAFAARDRITRAPKALGFVRLTPSIALTKAGKALLNGAPKDELFTRQLLKFQLPSPYHTQSKELQFSVKPYLELLRLIDALDSLSKTEIAMFFLQLTHSDKFAEICQKIRSFREKSTQWSGNRKEFIENAFKAEVHAIYHDYIERNFFKVRESDTFSLDKFIKTKMANMRDYADAFSRYIRSTELVTFQRHTYRLIISPLKLDEVRFLLDNISPSPEDFLSLESFQDYLFDPYTLELLSDDRATLVRKLKSFGVDDVDETEPLEHLKIRYFERQKKIQSLNIAAEQTKLKDYSLLPDILSTFDDIRNRNVPDPPLFLEWNVWRAFAMLNHAIRVDGHFKVDIDGMPLSTAPGNTADLEIEFDDFIILAEVTLSSGATQFKMESDSVPRHIGNCIQRTEKDVYCLFIAPKIHEGCLAHFYNLNRFATRHYGGKTRIIPVTLAIFEEFVKVGVRNEFSEPHNLKSWLDHLIKLNRDSKHTGEDEVTWQKEINESIGSWCLT